MKKAISFAILFCMPSLLLSQKIDNMVSFRDIRSNYYFRFSFDNDFFTSTDKNYTGGYNFELVSPKLLKNPINYLFFKLKKSEYKYGLAIEQIVYTPDDIKSTEIQFGDRPYAVALMLKSFFIANDTIQKSRLGTSLSVGLIGPGAFGKEIQTGIHKATGNRIPNGWCNQIQNDLVLNYEVSYEKQIIKYRNLISLQANSALRLGTLFTNAAVGLNTIIGTINSPFSPVALNNKWQVYFYSQFLGTGVGYDATLQGGLFNYSCYTIASKRIERFTAQHNYGVVVQSKGLYFEYSMTGITREFKSGSAANWGGIKFGFKL